MVLKDYKDIPLLLAFIGTLLVNIPQLYQTWTTREVNALSVYTMLLRILINMSWFVYGFFEKDTLILIMSVEVVLSECVLLLFKYMFSERESGKEDVPVEPAYETYK